MAKRPECPRCMSWTCGRCGHVRPLVCRIYVTENGDTPCARCRNVRGDYRPIRHHRDSTLQKCIDAWEAWRSREPVVLEPYNRDHIRSLDKLVRDLTDPRMRYFDRFKASLGRATHSDSWNESVNEGNAHLYEVERIVRAWVADHPENPPPDTGLRDTYGVTSATTEDTTGRHDHEAQ